MMKKCCSQLVDFENSYIINMAYRKSTEYLDHFVHYIPIRCLFDIYERKRDFQVYPRQTI